ncbi:MAG: type VI secretion protein IcmF/TssM N-terminal domain-containing protein, partial [Candidatus Poribacteria bacterium]
GIYILVIWLRGREARQEGEPSDVEKVEQLEERLVKAVEYSKDAPWYLVIGHSGCGKTTLLINSGLEFSFIDTLQEKPLQQEMFYAKDASLGDAKNAIILDTAGRYVTFGNESQERGEWLELLFLLRKYRKNKPIDGLIVAIDIPSLVENDGAGIEQQAKMIRERMMEMIPRLGMKFPVYVVFTKCDTLYGFTQFFDDLDAQQRTQVWGGTFRRDQQGNPEVVFREECERLSQILHSRKLLRLSAGQTQTGGAIYTFPSEFDAVYPKLTQFVGELFSGQSKEKPIFRGFYLTSGTQARDKIDLVLQDMAASLNHQPLQLPENPSDTVEAKSYFIKDLFQRVLFPDRGLEQPTTQVERRNMFVRLGICAAALAVFGVLTTTFAVSFRQNKRFMMDARLSAALISEIIPGGPHSPHELEQLESSRKSIVPLERSRFLWQKQKDDVAAAARKQYLSKKYGSSKGWEVKLRREVRIPVKVSKSSESENQPPEPIPKAEISAEVKSGAVAGKKRYKMHTNKEGEAFLKLKLEDGKVEVQFSVKHEEPGWEPPQPQIYDIQPGQHGVLKDEYGNPKYVRFIFSKLRRVIAVHCIDQLGEDLPGVPITIIEQTEELQEHTGTTNEQGIAQFPLEAPAGRELLIYYREFETNYEEQPDSLTIQSGQVNYPLDKTVRRKIQISVMAFEDSNPKPVASVSVGGIPLGVTNSNGELEVISDKIPTQQNVTAEPSPMTVSIDEIPSGYSIVLRYSSPLLQHEISVMAFVRSSQQPVSGVSVWVGEEELGVTNSNGELEVTSDTIPTQQNVTAEPSTEDVSVDPTPSGYKIVLKYAPPPPSLQVVTESQQPIGNVEVWIYLGEGETNSFNDEIAFESEGRQFRLVRLDATTDNDGRLQLLRAAESHQLLLYHPDYWPKNVGWAQVTQPIQMVSIRQERSVDDFDQAQRDGAEYYYERVLDYRNRGNWDEVIKNSQNALRLMPRLEFYLYLGWAYYDSAQIDEVREQANRGLALRLVDYYSEAEEQSLKRQLRNLRDLTQ